jgi:hypothetical protein
MTCGHTLSTGQAGDLAAWFAAHLPMDLRIKLMAERPLLYEALFPGCGHDVILDRVARALRSQAHDRMIRTSRPAAEHLLDLIQGTDHPWEGSDTVDAIEGFLGLWGITAHEPADEAPGADDLADAKRRLVDHVLGAVPADQRAAAEDRLTDLLYLAEGSLDAEAQAGLIRATLGQGRGASRAGGLRA